MVFDEWHPPLGAVSRVTSIVHREVPHGHGARRDRTRLTRAFGESGLEREGRRPRWRRDTRCPQLSDRSVPQSRVQQARRRLRRAVSETAVALRSRSREAVRGQVGGDITVGIRLSYDEFIGVLRHHRRADRGNRRAPPGDRLVRLLQHFLRRLPQRCTAPLLRCTIRRRFSRTPAKRIKNVVGTEEQGVLRSAGSWMRNGADRLVADGATDMVGMTRAQLADPFLVQKAREDRSRGHGAVHRSQHLRGSRLRSAPVALRDEPGGRAGEPAR